MSQIVLTVKQSPISGLGLFASTEIPFGKLIFKMFDLNNNGIYTGQIEPTNFINHSSNFTINPFVIEKDGIKSVYAVASQKIWPNTELTANYYDFEKWGLNTGVEKFLKNASHYQNLYNINRHKLSCDKPIGYKYYF